MLTQQVTIVNRLGLHARAAARFVQTAAAYKFEISVIKAGNKVNGKSKGCVAPAPVPAPALPC